MSRVAMDDCPLARAYGYAPTDRPWDRLVRFGELGKGKTTNFRSVNGHNLTPGRRPRSKK